MTDNAQYLTSLIERIVQPLSSNELQSIIDGLPDKPDDAAAVFCDHFELGNWFYEAMNFCDINITDVLVDLCTKLKGEEGSVTVTPRSCRRRTL